MVDMEHVTVYTASSVPAAASHPAINSLQWTEDGQLLFLTKIAVYILTPDLGVNCCSASEVATTQLKEGGPRANTLGWFRTVLELDRRSFHHWPSESQDWDSLVTGSLDVSIKSVVASPSFLSADAGCILAVITTNLELSLWGSVKNQLDGQWGQGIRLQDAVSLLRSLAVIRTDDRLQQTLQTQVVCSSWSRQPDFGAIPACICDGSLLAIGNRAGSILLLKFTAESGSDQCLEHVQTVDVSEQWITHLTWLPWTNAGENECVAMLVHCTSDGAVGLVKVTRKCHMESRGSEYGPGLVLETSVNRSQLSICKADDRIIMGLSFVETRDMEPIVVVLRPGVVQLWAEERDGSAWSGLLSFHLHSQGISSGSSMLYPPSGVVYSPEHDTLVLSLIDGSFHVIYDISSAPSSSLLGSTKIPYFSSGLSSISRRVFMHIEGDVITHAEMNRIYGMVSFGGFPMVNWAHERSLSSDFSYKHEARHSKTLVLTKIHAEDSDKVVLEMLADVIATAKACTIGTIAPGTAPIHTLRPILFRLVQGGVLTRLHSRFLQALRRSASESHLEIAIPPLIFTSSASPRPLFRTSIVRQLFGDDTLLRIRLKLAIADFCWRLSSSPENRNEFGTVARDLMSAISHRVLGILVQHIDFVAHLLTRDDLPFVLRVIIQCMLPGVPQELSVKAQRLADKVTAFFPPAGHETVSNGSRELCPACHVEVPLTDVTLATCSNGHRWPRCSVTSFILSTTKVQTCLGCARKALLPVARSRYEQESGTELSSGEGGSKLAVAGDSSSVGDSITENVRTIERGWIVQELLKAVRRCIFCGNNFAILV
ncbi:putative zinc-finger of transcription factor IIIC complex-domain-containing protein [Russula earlei]|uniref:Zinc-finger of transcription factor IIIC complex-domain-containing protein n=1 Tax=Russula earlei TaxID=71964 RepID=A0ACC0UGP3_9AGAM|nr:putative zinc-finger of transcription factor IIIC complex-domain-containing protein [Russula earlei]